MAAPKKGIAPPAGSGSRYASQIARARAQAPTQSASSPAGGTAPAGNGKYSWAGGPAKHSIPEAQHQQNSTPLDAPPSMRQAQSEANAAADLQFGPQVQAAQQQVANVKPWFGDYLARVAGYAQAAQQRMQPVLDQAQQLASPQAAQQQVPTGIDPDSDAGKAAALAAQGRAALAQLGQQALGANAQSTQDYFGGLGALGAREQPGAQAAAGQQLASAQSQRGAAVNSYLTNARQNAQNYAIARGTLDLNTGKAAADVASSSASTSEKIRHDRAGEKAATDRTAASTQAAADRTAAANSKTFTSGPFAGYTQDELNRHSQKWRDEKTTAYNAGKGKGGTEKDAQKHAQAITKATGSAKVKVQDIMDAWARGATMPAPTPKDKNATRPATRQELRNALGAKYGGTWVGIMERVRARQPLTPGQIDYLHSTDPNLRIPSEWLPRKPNIAHGTGNPSGASGTGLG